MAGLDTTLSAVPASQQFAAIAWLRWRLLANGFRRKGGKGELIARIIVYPIALILILGIIVGAGAAGYFAASTGNVSRLDLIFLGITMLQIVVSINVSPPQLSFEPQALIRYPVKFSTYVLIRLLLGLLSASTVVGTCALLAAATGATIAVHALWLPVFAAALALAVTNMLFIRMIFAWIDRWLATRRAREIFTAGIFLFSIGMQYLNVRFNFSRHSAGANQAKMQAFQHAYSMLEDYLTYLPSGRAGAAVVAYQQGVPVAAGILLCTVLAYAAVFLAIFAFRVHREYRGEDLSEGTISKPPPARTVSPARTHIAAAGEGQLTLTQSFDAAARERRILGLSADTITCLGKEWIYIRRNTAQIYTMLAPLAMVLLFAGRLGTISRTGFSFPIAVAYALLGTAALAYNSFGMDAAGIQFYYLAPVEMRSVILAKNLFGFGVNALQFILVFAFMTVTRGAMPVWIVLSTALWAIMTSATNATLGNQRSFKAPKKMDPGKVQRRGASGLSALISLGVVLGLGGIGAGLLFWAYATGVAWLPIPFLTAGAAAATAAYVIGLNKVDAIALDSRELMVEILTKAS